MPNGESEQHLNKVTFGHKVVETFPAMSIDCDRGFGGAVEHSLAGVEMEDALKTTLQGMKLRTGASGIMSCCSLGGFLRSDTCRLEKSFPMALMIRFFVSSSL